MTDGQGAAFCALSFMFTVATAYWFAVRMDAHKPPWPALIPLSIWFAPVAIKLWLAMIL